MSMLKPIKALTFVALTLGAGQAWAYNVFPITGFKLSLAVTDENETTGASSIGKGIFGPTEIIRLVNGRNTDDSSFNTDNLVLGLVDNGSCEVEIVVWNKANNTIQAEVATLDSFCDGAEQFPAEGSNGPAASLGETFFDFLFDGDSVIDTNSAISAFGAGIQAQKSKVTNFGETITFVSLKVSSFAGFGFVDIPEGDFFAFSIVDGGFSINYSKTLNGVDVTTPIVLTTED